ncbi:MAG: hypothetical protein ACI3XH_04020 [Phascolarctobacterium sp.]
MWLFELLAAFGEKAGKNASRGLDRYEKSHKDTLTDAQRQRIEEKRTELKNKTAEFAKLNEKYKKQNG